MKWPDLEAEVENWLADNRNSGIWVARRVIILKKEGGWLHTASLPGHFLGKRGEDCEMWTVVKCFKKH